MSYEPRLVIGIPTFDRCKLQPELLQSALVTAFGQTLPAGVIVADQGDDPECEEICRQWDEHPYFMRYKSPASCLWENWRFVAEKAIEHGAEFFSWLQDDDGINEKFCSRVVRAFDYFKDATVYCSNLRMSYGGGLGLLGAGNYGPTVPVDILHGKPQAWPGNLLVIAAYFSSWCMSPAKAFRVCDQFKHMLESIPANCDCYTERLDIATAAAGRQFIVDPKTAGYWYWHGKNESQLSGPTQAGQVVPAYAYLDSLMDNIPDWRQELGGWMGCLGNPLILETYYKQTWKNRRQGPYIGQILDIFEGALQAAGYDIPKLQAQAEETEHQESERRNGQLAHTPA